MENYIKISKIDTEDAFYKEEGDCVVIRQARAEDVSAIAAVEAEGFPAAEAADFQTLSARFQVFSESFLVAEDSDGICGYIAGAVIDSTILADECYHDTAKHHADGPYQSVFSLVSAQRVRGKGVAYALMEAFIEKAEKEGRRGLVLTCKDRLIPYYQKFGYQHQGVSASTHGGATWNDMLYLFEK